MFKSFEFAAATASRFTRNAGRLAATALGAGLLGLMSVGAVEAQTINKAFFVSDADGGQVLAGDTLNLTFQFQDFDVNYDFEDLGFQLVLSDAYSDLVLSTAATSPNCTGTVSGAEGDDAVTYNDGTLAGFSICSITASITLPDDIPNGLYTLTPSNLTGTAVHTDTTEVAIDQAIASASFTVESDTVAPSATFYFNNSTQPNAPFEVVLSFSEPVTGIEQSDISVTGGSITDFEAAGGDEGGSFATNFRITISPSGLGTVNVSVGAGAGQDEAGNDNTAAAGSVEIIDVATPSLDIQGGPFDPDDTASFVFTFVNNSPDYEISPGSFTIDLNSALSGTVAGAMPATPCGASSTASTISANRVVVISGMQIAAGGSCTFTIPAVLPSDAAPGSYVAGVNNFSYTIDGNNVSADSFGDSFTVSGSEGGGAPLTFTKAFSGDPVLAGQPVTLSFTIAAAEGTSATNLAFTDDLDAMISGAVATDLPLTDVCGTGSTLSGTSVITLAGGNLATDGSCTFEVTVSVPASASGGYLNTTSNLTGTQNDGVSDTAINADPAADTLTVTPAVPAVVLDGPEGDVDAASDFDVEIRFSESVTGFIAADLALTNATATLSGSGDTYTATVTPGGVGTITFQVPAGVAQDSDTNGNTASEVLSIEAVTAAPEIAVSGNGQNIADGDTVPSVADGTNFGSVDVASGTSTRTFTIANNGTSTLTLDPSPVSISGADAADFTVVSQPATSIAAGSSVTFQVTYDPSAIATDNATITIASDDADEASFDFAIRGTGITGPEINVTGNSVTIASGDVSPAAADDTDFGQVDLGTTLVRTFTIQNTGSGVLTLGADAVSVVPGGNFSVTSQPATTVAASGSTTFQITYEPDALIEDDALIRIANDDADENPYTFAVTGEGVGGPEVNLTGMSITILDEDLTPSTADGTDFGDVNVGESAVASFTIENTGTADLVLSPAPADRAGDTAGTTTVDVFGSGDFTILSQPTSPIAPGGTASFIVGYSPSSTGAAAATTIAFGTDDFDELRYDFAVTGFATTPELSVYGESIAITDGDTTPNATDGTLFGSYDEDSGSESQTFTIGNDGDGPLTLGANAVSVSGANAADFTVSTQPATSLESGDTTYFIVTFDPSGTGARTATISIANDDLDESPFTFSVEGEGLDVTAPTGFTVSFDDDPIGSADAGSTGFSFTGAEVGTTYDYSISSDGGGTPVSGTGAIATATDSISGIDVSGLNDGTLTLSVTLTDAASNVSDAETDTATLDQTAPTVTITGPSDAQTGAFTATFTFSESVTGFVLGDISVGNGAASALAGSGDTYTATITPAADGTVTVDVAGSVATDAAGNDNTAATQFSVEADVTQPTLTISGPGTTQTGAFTATFTFSEDVTGFALADITVGNGSASSLAGSGDTYTATITPAADGTVTVDVAANAATDIAGNGNTAATQFSVLADITVPSVTISGPGTAQTGAFTATFTFSESVTGFALADITVGNGSASGLAGSGDTYTATITPTTDGSVTVDVAANVATDAAGNGNSAATQFSVTADLTAPSVSITGPSSDQNAAFTVSFEFSESVTGFALADITVGNGTASGLTGSGDEYSATITPSADGTVTVDLAANAVTDAAGNGNTAATQFSVEADLTQPTVTVSGPAGVQTGAFTVTFTFSESVTGFALDDVVASNATASTFAGSGSVYTVTITPQADGLVSVTTEAGAAVDSAGNSNAEPTAYTTTADITGPTVAITGPSDVQTGAFTATFTFSESVTGFALGDISVGNGSASGFSGTGDTYTATITPSADGTVTVDVAAGAATDAAGNGNNAAPQFTVEADLTAPSVVLSGPSVDQSGAFDVTVTFSEDVTGLQQADFTIGNGSVSGLSGSGDTYTVSVTPAADGTVTVDLGADAATDAAGNGNTAATQFSVNADLTAPGLTISAPATTQAGAFTASFTFTESVTGFTVDDIGLSNATASDFAGSGTSYTATITPDSDGDVVISVAADVAVDAGGNGNTAATDVTVSTDLQAPTVEIDGPADVQTGTFEVTVTFSEAVTNFVQNDLTVGNGTVEGLSGSGADYIARIAPAGDGTVTIDIAAGAAFDSVGNPSEAATQFTVEADVTAPTVTLSGPTATQTGDFTVAISFSESVEGFAAADITVGNGSVDSLTGSGSSYTATITPDADGSVTVDVAAGVATDAAGNANTAASQFSVDADISRPAVTLSGPTADQTGAFTLTVTFTESVTGFTVDDIALDNATASGFAGSGTAYTVTLTPVADGTVTATVAANVATDAAGNGNTAASPFSVEADVTAPGVTISGPTDVQTGTFALTVTFSEAVTGFRQNDVTVANGSVSGLSGSGSDYTVQIVPADDGTVTVDIAAGAAVDASGNASTAATQYAVEADVSLPSVAGITVSDDDVRAEDAGSVFTVAVTFSEAMDVSVSPEIEFDTPVDDTLSFTAGSFSGDGLVYTASYDVEDGGESATDIDVTVSGAQDEAGNAAPEATVADLFSVEMRRGSITIVQTVDGAIDDTFAFTGDLGAFSVTTSDQTGEQAFEDLAEGSYTIAAQELDGFTLQDISCVGGTTATDLADGTATVTLAPNDTVTCTFDSLAEPEIDVASIPDVTIELPEGAGDPTATSTSFELTNTGGEAFYFLASTDVEWLEIDPTSGAIPAEGDLEFTVTFTDAVLELDPGTYTATITIEETDGPAASARVSTASDNELMTVEIPVTVTIEAQEGNLTLVTTTAPSVAGDGSFAYASSIEALNGLTLTTSGGSASSDGLTVLAGSYTLSQGQTEGWQLDSISCVGDTDGGSSYDLETGTATIDVDADEEIVCTFANRRDEDYIVGVTQSAIRSFMATRADQILTNDPRLNDRMRPDRAGATPTRFSADFRDGQARAELSTSLSSIRQAAEESQPQQPGDERFSLAGKTGVESLDVWVQASFSSVSDDRAGLNSDTDFGLYYLGADMLANEDLMIGWLVQFDRAKTVTGDLRSQVEGDGWMTGPYAVARLSDTLYLDVRGAWGQSDNSVNPIGTYTDDFETDRWLIEAHLTGDYIYGNWRVSPELGIAWFDETQAAYTDSLGFLIPDQDLQIGRVSFGPEVAYRFVWANGGFFEPYLRLNALYDYDDADVINAAGVLQGLGDLRADARLGLNAELANGGRISGEVSVMGVGEGDFEANGAMLRVRLPLSMD